jgi:hypothetical protein
MWLLSFFLFIKVARSNSKNKIELANVNFERAKCAGDHRCCSQENVATTDMEMSRMLRTVL